MAGVLEFPSDFKHSFQENSIILKWILNNSCTRFASSLAFKIEGWQILNSCYSCILASYIYQIAIPGRYLCDLVYVLFSQARKFSYSIDHLKLPMETY